MSTLTDIYHWWGGDLQIGNTGDLLGVKDIPLGQQRVLRRLLTNPGDYLFHPTYGAGLPQYVGQPLDVQKLSALIRSQVLLEDAVAKTPAPQITVNQTSPDPSGINVRIAYNDAATNTPVVLAFSVTK